MELAYVNGRTGPIAEAVINIEDRALQFGDGIYEVIRGYDGRLFELDRHLERLQTSASLLEIELPMDAAEIGSIARDLLSQSRLPSAQLYIQVTRGTAPRGHFFPEVPANLIMTVRELAPVPEETIARGIALHTVRDRRWELCNIKSTSLLPNVLAKEEARRAGAYEALFVREEGLVAEGGSSNVFIVRGGDLATPPADNHILNGITRRVVMEVAAQLGLTVRERHFAIDELKAAEEVFLTSTNMEVLPVTTVDNRRVADGRPGDITLKLLRAYQERTKG